MRPAPELDRPPLLLLAQHLVHRRARGAGELGQLLLGERDLPVAAWRSAPLSSDEPAQHAPLDRDVERLEQQLVLAPHLARRGTPISTSVDLPGAPCAAGGTPPGRRRASPRPRARRRWPSAAPLVHQRHLAEAVARDRESPIVTVSPSGVMIRDREATLLDQVQRVGRILAVEDDLAAARSVRRARDRDQPPHLLLGHTRDEPPAASPNYVTPLTQRQSRRRTTTVPAPE